MIKKYGDLKNISGELIQKARENKGISREDLSILLQLEEVYINRNEIRLMERNELMIKDFELAAIGKILDIDLNQIKNCFMKH